MSIIAACACGQRVQVKDTLAGKQVKCPKCAGPIAIPLADGAPMAAAAPLAAAAPAPPPAPPPSQNAGGDLGFDLGGFDLGSGLTPLEQPAGFGAPPAYTAQPIAAATPMPQQAFPQQGHPQQQFAPQHFPQQPFPQQQFPQQPYPQQAYPQQQMPGPAQYNPYQAPAYQPGQFRGQFSGQMAPQAPISGHRPLTPEQRTRYNLLSFALGIPGLLAYFGSAVIANVAQSQDQPVLMIFSMVGFILAIVLLGGGFAFSAMYKGYHPALGLLGFLGCIGLIVIAILPDKAKPLPQYAMPQYPMQQWPGGPR